MMPGCCKRALLATGDKAGALAAFQKLAAGETSPRAADALVEIGMLHYDARKYDLARDAFTSVRTRFSQARRCRRRI